MQVQTDSVLVPVTKDQALGAKRSLRREAMPTRPKEASAKSGRVKGGRTQHSKHSLSVKRSNLLKGANGAGQTCGHTTTLWPKCAKMGPTKAQK